MPWIKDRAIDATPACGWIAIAGGGACAVMPLFHGTSDWIISIGTVAALASGLAFWGNALISERSARRLEEQEARTRAAERRLQINEMIALGNSESMSHMSGPLW